MDKEVGQMIERTFLMVKPDGVQRGLVGEIISRFEKRGFKIVGLKLTRIDRETAKKHYAEHEGKPFFDGLVDYITSAPTVSMVIEGKNAVSVVRKMVGATDPKNAPPGTIRGDFALEVGRNIIHASDSPESAEREISLFFNESELANYERIDEKWLYEWR
ncbi:MAG: nucleoside-diphosphate kinase [Candidatus Syntropharchaeia archaeon]